MRIAVLSDTHVSRIRELPKALVDRLKDVDLVVHVGDYTGKEFLDELRKLVNFRGVRGNMDPPDIRGALPDKDILEVNGKRIGLIHGLGAPIGLEERIRKEFENVHAIVYGHS